jgi:hypothetical protein
MALEQVLAKSIDAPSGIYTPELQLESARLTSQKNRLRKKLNRIRITEAAKRQHPDKFRGVSAAHPLAKASSRKV